MGLAERLRDAELDAACDVLDEQIERDRLRLIGMQIERERLMLRTILAKETKRAELARQRMTPEQRDADSADLTRELTRLADLKERAA